MTNNLLLVHSRANNAGSVQAEAELGSLTGNHVSCEDPCRIADRDSEASLDIGDQREACSRVPAQEPNGSFERRRGLGAEGSERHQQVSRRSNPPLQWILSQPRGIKAVRDRDF